MPVLGITSAHLKTAGWNSFVGLGVMAVSAIVAHTVRCIFEAENKTSSNAGRKELAAAILGLGSGGVATYILFTRTGLVGLTLSGRAVTILGALGTLIGALS